MLPIVLPEAEQGEGYEDVSLCDIFVWGNFRKSPTRSSFCYFVQEDLSLVGVWLVRNLAAAFL